MYADSLLMAAGDLSMPRHERFSLTVIKIPAFKVVGIILQVPCPFQVLVSHRLR